jgi:hypothetical protein
MTIGPAPMMRIFLMSVLLGIKEKLLYGLVFYSDRIVSFGRIDASEQLP